MESSSSRSTGRQLTSPRGVSRLYRCDNLLFQEGLEVNAEDVDGWTLLHWAARHGDLAVIYLSIASSWSES